ncbi:MAG: hypothetical protein JWQ07_5493, partial [Ramlibacter sp.]|nr:hypothetical protein [Ramlibacter sp.]
MAMIARKTFLFAGGASLVVALA